MDMVHAVFAWRACWGVCLLRGFLQQFCLLQLCVRTLGDLGGECVGRWFISRREGGRILGALELKLCLWDVVA